MKNKLLCFFAVLSLLLSLCSCGGDAAETDTDAGTDIYTDNETEADSAASDSGELVYLLISKIEYYDPNPGDEVTTSYRYGYNEKGQIVYVRNDGETEPFFTVTYDASGELCETVELNITSYNKDYLKCTYENGRMTGKYEMNRYNDVIGKTEYEYDEYGQSIRETVYDIKGEIKSELKYKYTYDENGNYTKKYRYDSDNDEWRLMSEREYDSEDRLVYANGLEYIYDENGNLLCVNYYIDDKLDSYIVYEYDDKGRELSQKEYYIEAAEENGEADAKLIYSYEYTYDDDRLLSKISDGYEERYTYAENGQLLEHKTVKLDDYGRLNEETYTYDGNGNILSYTEYNNGELTHKIEYEYREMRIAEEYGELRGNNDWLIQIAE